MLSTLEGGTALYTLRACRGGDITAFDNEFELDGQPTACKSQWVPLRTYYRIGRGKGMPIEALPLSTCGIVLSTNFEVGGGACYPCWGNEHTYVRA